MDRPALASLRWVVHQYPVPKEDLPPKVAANLEAGGFIELAEDHWAPTAAGVEQYLHEDHEAVLLSPEGSQP